MLIGDVIKDTIWFVIYFSSKLTCIYFGSWDNNKEWSISMNENEDIQVDIYIEMRLFLSNCYYIIKFR
jgi:hypothetical protein